MPATGTSLLASATTHRKLMSPKVLNPDDGAAFLAIVRELYDVDQQIETLAGERTDGIAGDGALRDRIHKAQRRHLELRERAEARSEEHTSELQSLMRISYAVFCLKTKIVSTKLTTT